jgi:hypothetical protein
MKMKTRNKAGLKTREQEKQETRQDTKLKSGLQRGKNLLVGDRLYIEESQYTPQTPHETLATYTGAG